MIQRIQTIYLSLLIICIGLTFIFPFSSYTVNDASVNYTVSGFMLNGKQILNIPLYFILIGILILSLISIVLYKKRKLQLTLNKINYLLILGVIVLIFLDFGTIGKVLGEGAKSVSYGVGMFLPLAALVFNFMANRGIKQDEKLINSLDRLR